VLRKSESAEVCPALCRCRWLDHSGRDHCAIAEMSDVSGGIPDSLDWNRAFVLSRDAFARVAFDSVRWIDFIPGDEKHASPDSQIKLARTNN
jgi:hypothetical protein